MRLIVLDTNVIVSAGINGMGPPAKIIMDWVLEGEVQTVVCPLVTREYFQVMNRPKFQSYGFPPLWLEYLVAHSITLEEPGPWPVQGPDPDDLRFLALAKSAGAWLVTGNLVHYPSEIRLGVTVVSPADYITILQKHSLV